MFESKVLEAGLRQGWADSADWRVPKYNQVDGKINRISFLGTIQTDDEGRPLVRESC